MELNIKVEGENPIEDAEDLKNFLENRQAAGLNEIEMARSKHGAGEQGLGDFIGGLILKMTGGDEVIKGIVSLINKFAEQRDKRIYLGNGIIIPPNTLSSEEILKIVT